MGGKTQLINSGGYKLYNFTWDKKAKKPIFSVYRDERKVFYAECTSLFLDPGFILRGEKINIDVVSQDRQEFDIISNKENIGHISVCENVVSAEKENAKKDKKETVEIRYETEINETYFDDYVPLIGVFIDIAFGELNKG